MSIHEQFIHLCSVYLQSNIYFINFSPNFQNPGNAATQLIGKKESIQHVESARAPSVNSFDIHCFDLRSVLNTYAASKRFLKKYESNQINKRELNDTERKKLCNAIVNWAIESNILLKSNDYPQIFDRIKAVFHEEMYTNYYSPSTSYIAVDPKTNKKYRKQIVASGSLYNSWKYHIQQLRDEEKQMGHDVRKLYINKNAAISKYTVELPEIEVSLINLKEWLAQSFDPWSLIVENWKKTFPLRAIDLRDPTKSFDNILANWPQYKRKGLYELLDIDYNMFFPKKDTFKERWSKYRKRIIELALSQKNNSEFKKKVSFFKDLTDKEENIESILALHALFLVIPNKNSNSKKNLDKILLQAKPGVTILATLLECSEKAKNDNFSPIIIYEVNEDSNPNKFYACLNDMSFQFENIISAIDVIFKAIMVFNLSYAEECKVMCTFIQHFFFDLYYESDFRGSSLIKWMSRLDKTIARNFEKRVLTQDFDVKIKDLE